MILKYNAKQRQEYLKMTERNGQFWVEVFRGNVEFYSAPYWDLLTGIWKCDGPVRKTDASKMMVSIKSAQTAGKYVEAAIQRGFIHEVDNPQDARSKLLALSADMEVRLDEFFDKAVDELRKASRTVESAGSNS
jgi:inosine-uridine nucleoside N-ribohydrolase